VVSKSTVETGHVAWNGLLCEQRSQSSSCSTQWFTSDASAALTCLNFLFLYHFVTVTQPSEWFKVTVFSFLHHTPLPPSPFLPSNFVYWKCSNAGIPSHNVSAHSEIPQTPGHLVHRASCKIVFAGITSPLGLTANEYIVLTPYFKSAFVRRELDFL